MYVHKPRLAGHWQGMGSSCSGSPAGGYTWAQGTPSCLEVVQLSLIRKVQLSVSLALTSCSAFPHLSPGSVVHIQGMKVPLPQYGQHRCGLSRPRAFHGGNWGSLSQGLPRAQASGIFSLEWDRAISSTCSVSKCASL